MIRHRKDRILEQTFQRRFETTENQQDMVIRPNLGEVTSPIKKPILILRPKEVWMASLS